MYLKEERKSKLKINIYSFVALILTVSPILDPYVLFSIKGSDVHLMHIISIFMIFLIIVILNNTKSNTLMIPIVIVISCLSTISILYNDGNRSFSMILKNLLIWLILSFIIGMLWENYDYNKFIKYAYIIAIIAAILLIIQFISLNIGINNVYNGKLPGINLSKYDGWSSMFNASGEIRVHSFFQEPSYLCIFFLPIVAKCLEERKYLLFMLFLISILISTSSIGIAGIILVIVNEVFRANNAWRNKRNLILVVIISSIVCFILYLTNSTFHDSINFSFIKILNMESDLNSSRMGSTRFRLLGYIELFKDFNIFYKLFGLGAEQYFNYFNLDISYSNTIVTILLNYGILGLCYFFVFLNNLYKRYSQNNKIYLIIFILLCFTDQIWFNWYFFYLITWIICDYKISEDKYDICNSTNI